MTTLVDNEQNSFGRLIADELRDVLGELQAIELVDLVSYIRFDHFAAIEDLLQSSTELFFRESTFTFAWSAAVTMAWGTVPAVTLGMEFNHLTVSVFFNLTLPARDGGVEVSGLLFDPECRDPVERRRRLVEALADARLPRARTFPALPPTRGAPRPPGRW